MRETSALLKIYIRYQSFSIKRITNQKRVIPQSILSTPSLHESLFLSSIHMGEDVIALHTPVRMNVVSQKGRRSP